MTDPSKVTRAQLAKLCGRSPAFITQSIQGGKLGPPESAVFVPGSKKIFVDHPVVKEFIRLRGNRDERAHGEPNRSLRARPETKDPIQDNQFPEDILSLLDKTVRDLLGDFGTVDGLNDWLKSVKMMHEIDKKERDRRSEEGELVSRQFVTQHVLGLVDRVFRRLLTDAPRTITARVYDAAKADRPRSDVTGIIEEIISSTLRSLKRDVADKLKEAG